VALSPVSFVERSAEVFGDLPAVVHGARRYTWAQVRDRSARLAAALRALGVGRGSTVSVMLPNTPEMVEAHYAVPALNAVLNTLNTRLDAPLLAWQMHHCEASVLITDREFAATMGPALEALRTRAWPRHRGDRCLTTANTPAPARAWATLEYEACWPRMTPLPALEGPADEWDAIAVSYTSGTTGDPKGVVTHHRGAYLNAVCNAATWTMPQFPRLPVDAADVPLQRLVLPLDGGDAGRHPCLPAPGRCRGHPGGDAQPRRGPLLRRAHRKDGKPIYPEMDKHTVLFGGTDPGRFNPTYMIFCESFLDPKFKPNDPNFDRRDVYLITQNALADGTYLQYIRAHYNRVTQPDPPFFSELLRGPRELAENTQTNWLARLALPVDRFFLDLGDSIEKERRVGSSYFKPDHFTNATAFAAKLKAGADPVSQHVYGALSADTRSAIGSDANSSSARKLLAADLNKLLEAGPLFEASRFAGVSLSQHVKWFVEENPQSHTRIRLNRLLLEEAYPQEITKSPGGVYPDREIKTPSNEDSQRCFNEYITDANRRLEHDTRNPGAPRQIKVGEDVKVIGGRVQVSGQVAVMAINGLLTKVIFDANPNHEFYVEESFPLDWMYPHLTPFGIIMKINRNPVPEITQEIVDKDHEFWSEYSERLIGKWITYDTTISNICAFAERVYLKRDFEGFTGDRAFVRDSDAQKAFSKLRSSIGGLYAWRLQNSRSAAEQQRVLKEAEFAFKQSFAYCPYSPEAVFRYINILVSMNRFDDALLLSKTSLKFDPANGQLRGLIDELERIRGSNFAPPTPAAALPQVQKLQETIQQVMALMQAQQTNQALTLVDGLMNSSASDVSAMLFAAQMYNQSFQYSKAETALSRYAKLSGENPEAWFDLAGMQAILSKSNEAMASLKSALTFDAQRKAKAAPGSAPSPHDLVQLAKTDPRFAGIRTFPQFNALIESLSAKQP
jgi:tetratricopeptide (TPR) repeat protein